MKRIILFGFLIIMSLVVFSCKKNISYQIEFDSNGGTTVESIILNEDQQLFIPFNPEKDGYIFLGWYVDNETFLIEFNQDYLDQTPLTEDIKVYAQWLLRENAVLILFDTKGGPSLDATFVERGSTIVCPEISKRGYELNYWYAIINHKIHFAVDGLFNVVFSESEITLIANWNTIYYNISYELNGGSNDLLNPDLYTIESDSFELLNPTRIGYDFMGWYNNETFLGSPISEIFKGSVGDIILYAKWEIHIYEINYNLFDHDITNTDIPLNPGEEIIKITLGAKHSGLLTSDGQLFTWGKPYYGQLGYYSSSYLEPPSNITSQFDLEIDEKISNIFMSGYSSYAITTSGKVFAWGSNSFGQLGDSTTINRFDPLDVTSNFGLLTGETIIMLSVSSNSLALTSFGRVLVWGNGFEVELEDGSYIDATLPTDITFQFELETNETIISASICYNHSIALTSSGRVFSWGVNSSGQIGDGTTIPKSIPIDITSYFPLFEGETIIDVDLLMAASIALSSTGRVFTWGNNSIGVLGDGTEESSYIPKDITSHITLNPGESIVKISSGIASCVVITSSQRIFSWGWILFKDLWEIEKSYITSPNEMFTNTSILNDEVIEEIHDDGLNYAIITESNRAFAWAYVNEALIAHANESWNIYEILVDENAMTQSSEQSTYNSTINLYEPSREGYTFSGWFTDMQCQNIFNLELAPPNDLILYGYWIPNE